METSKKKDFDCLELKRELQAIVYAKTKDMTSDELIAYFNAAPHVCRGHQYVKVYT
jgi:hypothetical protein